MPCLMKRFCVCCFITILELWHQRTRAIDSVLQYTAYCECVVTYLELIIASLHMAFRNTSRFIYHSIVCGFALSAFCTHLSFCDFFVHAAVGKCWYYYFRFCRSEVSLTKQSLGKRTMHLAEWIKYRELGSIHVCMSQSSRIAGLAF